MREGSEKWTLEVLCVIEGLLPFFFRLLCSSSRAGKSSIVARFLGNRFEEAYTPTIEEFHRKLYRIRNEVFQLDILDTSGYHPFPAMRRLSFLTGEFDVRALQAVYAKEWESVCDCVRVCACVWLRECSYANHNHIKRTSHHLSCRVPGAI